MRPEPALTGSGGGAAEAVENARPFRQIRRLFDDDILNPDRVTAMQFSIEGAGKRLGIVWNDTDAGKGFAVWNPGVRKNVNGRRVESQRGKLVDQRGFVQPIANP